MRLKFSLLALFVLVGFGLWWGGSHSGSVILSPQGDKARQELPYDKYSFERLAQRGGVASKIEVSGSKFYYWSEGRRISGEINYPPFDYAQGLRGVVVMARGYVEKEIYKTGMGTHSAARYFSEHGYITYAPDFSGYGESSPEDENALGARLVKPVEILDLIASIGGDQPIYLWGHSNGGQIMLSVVEIIGKSNYFKGSSLKVRGVTLWAPVSKPFPYNILFYTDEASDSGKWLRAKISEFERDYDVFEYSVDRYLDWIELPVQIHQGTGDESVPSKWSDELAKSLRDKGKEVNYFVYPGTDHNFKPGWDRVVGRDVEWFQSL